MAIDWTLAYWISVVLFICFIAFIAYRDRKSFKRDFIVLLRKTQRGKRFLISTGTGHPTFWKWVGGTGVMAGFLASIWIVYQFVSITIQNIMVKPVPSVGLVVPSPFPTATIGPGFYAVPFWYWIIAIGLLALVHEGFHGIMSARERVRIKSLGWGLLLVIPLAFVEPDEKQLEKKGRWPQLRVFAAGSFANFITAAVSLGLLLLMATALFSPAGVTYRGYPGTVIQASDITSIAGVPVTGDSIISALEGTQAGFVELEAGGKEYYGNTTMMLDSAREGGGVAVFEGYSAVKENLTGIIISVDGEEVRDAIDLRIALDRAGAGREIEVVTTDFKEERRYSLMTKEEPEPVFKPSLETYMLGSLEHVAPGVSASMESAFTGLSSMLGNKPVRGWRELQLERQYWEFLGEAYPGLSARAGGEVARVDAELAGHPRGGFIGIAEVSAYTVVVAGLEPIEAPLNFIQGLLFWIFLINLGVGAFNLLPIKPLDGGRMWEILLTKLSRRHGKGVMRVLSYLTLLMLLFNMLVLFI